MVNASDIRPFNNNDDVENKDDLRKKLEDQVAAFLAKGGKVDEIPAGTSESTIKRDSAGRPVSGIDNIVWDDKREQWSVLAFGRKHPIAYVDDLNEAITIKGNYKKKMKKLVTRTRGQHLTI